MKTDRELLELSAKAAGLRSMGRYDFQWGLEVSKPHNAPYQWNPLNDDGDALRLAVKLGICIGPESPYVIGKSLARASWLNHSKSLGEWGGGDQYSATRRAIVRAAAAIGEAM